MLECAAGTGAISIAARPGPGTSCVRICPCRCLSRPKPKAARLGLANISFERRDLLSLPEPGRLVRRNRRGQCHPLPAPEDAVGELWRVTRPGGLLLLPTFCSRARGGWGFTNI